MNHVRRLPRCGQSRNYSSRVLLCRKPCNKLPVIVFGISEETQHLRTLESNQMVSSYTLLYSGSLYCIIDTYLISLSLYHRQGMRDFSDTRACVTLSQTHCRPLVCGLCSRGSHSLCLTTFPFHDKAVVLRHHAPCTMPPNWLPVEFRIGFEFSLLTWKTI